MEDEIPFSTAVFRQVSEPVTGLGSGPANGAHSDPLTGPLRSHPVQTESNAHAGKHPPVIPALFTANGGQPDRRDRYSPTAL
jgi:hypothetical protein